MYIVYRVCSYTHFFPNCMDPGPLPPKRNSRKFILRVHIIDYVNILYMYIRTFCQIWYNWTIVHCIYMYNVHFHSYTLLFYWPTFKPSQSWTYIYMYMNTLTIRVTCVCLLEFKDNLNKFSDTMYSLIKGAVKIENWC